MASVDMPDVQTKACPNFLTILPRAAITLPLTKGPSLSTVETVVGWSYGPEIIPVEPDLGNASAGSLTHLITIPHSH